ncbi:flagellar basal-body rod protein FlgF [Thermosipho ferrireducens]|uniref:Flagellar basal-body rod protein FlgF n=1 Tax=Thermosipho ferrireducens TaxID=2571116 RepID=A0ABX7SBB4_9BACT|nr:flagellar basal-body rod protein FlgF [Thermosipho ferrireducens]QTA38670.1 flagellar basal-body rod protein FlgF [Thermosipho ferrireducens]
MYRGVYLAAMGMLADITKLDTLSNNLSNANTTGFKSDGLAFKTYLNKEIYALKPEPENKKMRYIKLGSFEQALVLDEVKTNFSQGVLEHTGVPTNMAIDGSGFFVVKKGDKTLYTRNGEFILNNEGYLTTNEGYYVLDVNGKPIKLDRDFEIADDGTIVNNGRIVKIAIVELDNLQKLGNTFFTGSPKTIRKQFRILPGYVEKSNVDIVKNMVKMIEATRHYEVLAKAIVVHDELLNKSVNSVGTLR